MPDNVVKEEVLYTYDAAINLYERRKYNDWVHMQGRLQAIREEQKAERRYFCNQKLYGLLITVFSLLILLVKFEELAIIGIVGVIAGIAIMVTKKMVIYNEYYRTHGGADQWTK